MRRHLAWLLASTAGCLDPTQVTLEIHTEVGCEAAPETSIVVAQPEDVEGQAPSAVTRNCGSATLEGTASRIGTLVAHPDDEPDVPVAFKVTANLAGGSADGCETPIGVSADCVVARRQLRFIENVSLELPVILSEACRGVTCLPGDTCFDGDCVSAVIDPFDCPDGICGEDVLPEPAPVVDDWVTILSSPNPVVLSAMDVDAQSGSIFLAGSFREQLTVGPLILDAPAQAVFVLELDGSTGAPVDAATLELSVSTMTPDSVVRTMAVANDDVFIAGDSGGAMLGSTGVQGSFLLSLPRGGLAGTPSFQNIENSMKIHRIYDGTDGDIDVALTFVGGVIPGETAPYPVGGAYSRIAASEAISHAFVSESGMIDFTIDGFASGPNGAVLGGELASDLVVGASSVPATHPHPLYLAWYDAAQGYRGHVTMGSETAVSGVGVVGRTDTTYCAAGEIQADASTETLVFDDDPNVTVPSQGERSGWVGCIEMASGVVSWALGVGGAETSSSRNTLQAITGLSGDLYFSGYAEQGDLSYAGMPKVSGHRGPYVIVADQSDGAYRWHSLPWTTNEDAPDALFVRALEPDVAVLAADFRQTFTRNDQTYASAGATDVFVARITPDAP